MTSTFNPSLPMERELGKQLYRALQGPVVETILQTAKDCAGDDYWRSRMEGHCMKVDKEIIPDSYVLCQDVKKRLNFKDAVDFYVTDDSTLNARTMKLMARTIHQHVIIREADLTERPAANLELLEDVAAFKWDGKKGKIGF